ncbi:MAG: LytTR family DNA-binding domain-containing protein [Gemmatimonadaceae bacterium]
MTLRVLIADDEPPARARVRAMLASHEDCTIVGEAEDGRSAADLLVTQAPDVVFLDIKMPELNGFEVVEALQSAEGVAPVVVFVTAYDEFAIKAFEVGALDYLLKPFDQARFDKALAAASEQVALRRLRAEGGMPLGMDPSLVQVLRSLSPATERPARFLVRRGRQMQFVRVEDIDWLEADGNYVSLHVQGRVHLLRETMTAMEAKLDPEVFVRVHRSAIVNIDRVMSIEPHTHGEYALIMRDRSRLTTSAAHSARLRGLLGK